MSSSPKSIGGPPREGTRVVLREITASLHNSPPMQLLQSKSGNDSSPGKAAEHEVKVRFAREFADVGSISYSAAESLSSASSFQSLSSSLSAKSSSGICPDSVPPSPSQPGNTSYVNADIPGVEDLILACADIRLHGEEDHSFEAQDFSQDQTFTSATDETIGDLTKEISNNHISPVSSCNVTQIVESESTSREVTYSPFNYIEDIRERPILVIPSNNSNLIGLEESKERSISPNRSNDLVSVVETCSFTVSDGKGEVLLSNHSTEESNLNCTASLSASEAISTDTSEPKEHIAVENPPIQINASLLNCTSYPSVNVVTTESVPAEHVEDPSLPSISSLSSLNATDFAKPSENDTCAIQDDVKSLLLTRSSSPVNDTTVAITASFQDALKSPAPEVEDKSDSRTETVSPSFCNAANDEEIYADLLRPSTPDVKENSEINVCTEIDGNTTLSNVELSPVKVDSPEVNVPLAIKDEGKEQEEGEEVEEVENKLDGSLVVKELNIVEETEPLNITKEKEEEKEEEEEEGEGSFNERLDATLTFQDVSLTSETVPEVEQYTEFKPQRQSTTLALPLVEQPNFDELKSAAEEVANDFFKSSLEFSEENDQFISATSQLFQEPMNFDLLISHGRTNTVNRLHTESLYVKFDPLVSDISMLPQGNAQPINEEQNGKIDSTPPNIDTPKRNPAIAAIDRLLFYSPISTSMTQKMEEPREKIEQPVEVSKPETPLITDVNMSKELELVRTTVLQLEEELEKQKKEYETELERQKSSFQEKINKLQAQITQESRG
ncbi:transforming acidic coiled-coil protein isoform X2 [Calliopsis andreniformis]|uniref:transforming acidic coiled-coil protein isoform X2 n=1 Tax=Calliopsis andreniformis TaxID=337506 RepID=UPI003FCCF08A